MNLQPPLWLSIDIRFPYWVPTELPPVRSASQTPSLGVSLWSSALKMTRQPEISNFNLQTHWVLVDTVPLCQTVQTVKIPYQSCAAYWNKDDRSHIEIILDIFWSLRKSLGWIGGDEIVGLIESLVENLVVKLWYELGLKYTFWEQPLWCIELIQFATAWQWPLLVKYQKRCFG